VSNREQKRWQHYAAAKQQRNVRKEIKRNRDSKPPRQRDWHPGDPEDADELAGPQVERVMPVGEQERRRTVMSKAQASLSEASADEPGAAGIDTGDAPGDSASETGLVVEVSAGLCRVETEGRSRICSLRGSLSAEDTGFTNVVAVGDRVIVSGRGAERGVVESVLPRRSLMARPDVFYSHLQQAVVANADQLLIIASWSEPALWLELVDRYLITAGRNNLSPVICVNKIDLAESERACREALAPYAALGHPVLYTSAQTGQGVDALRGVLRGKMTVLAGLSGVGKSSLLAAAQPGLNLRVAEVSAWLRGGRHTTTQARLWKLESGGSVVDTPGIREFGLSGVRRDMLMAWYPDLGALAADCRFGNCAHLSEPDCAVRAAALDGRLPAVRYHNYTKIYADLPA
jgi:ribosome biogenesis GTPase